MEEFDAGKKNFSEEKRKMKRSNREKMSEEMREISKRVVKE